MYGTEVLKRMFVRKPDEQFVNAALGLAGEAGEVVDYAKKVLFHPRNECTPTTVDLRKELGDVLWYLAALNELVFGDSLLDVARENIQKLKERYPERYGDVDIEALTL